MTEQEQEAPKEEATIVNPLGRDEAEPESPPQESSDEPTPEQPATEEQQETVDWEAKAKELQTEWDKAQDAISFYNTVANDPKATEVIVDYFQNQTGVEESSPQEGGDLQALQKEVEQLKQQLNVESTARAIDKWLDSKPGYREMAPQAQKLMQEHPTLQLEQAFKLALDGKQPNPAQQLQSTETQAVPNPRSGGDSTLDDVTRQIVGARDTEEAVRLAFEAAQRGVRPDG